MTGEGRCIQCLRLPSFPDLASSDDPASCFACVKRRSECHYSHLADLIELFIQSLTQKMPSSDERPGSRIVLWVSIRPKEKQNEVGILPHTLRLPMHVTLDFSLRLYVGQYTNSGSHRMAPPTLPTGHFQGRRLAPLRCSSPTFPSPILQLPTFSRPSIPSGKHVF